MFGHGKNKGGIRIGRGQLPLWRPVLVMASEKAGVLDADGRTCRFLTWRWHPISSPEKFLLD
jgi:hypothetical protein